MTFDERLAELMAEKNAEIARLTALLPVKPAPGQVWRQGTKNPANLYIHADGLAPRGVPAGQMPSAEIAAHVVRAVNAWDWGSEPSEGRKVLDTPMDDEFPTVRHYLTWLLTRLWSELGGFSGHHGLGSAGGGYWKLYTAVVRAGMAGGTFDDDGSLHACDEAEAHRLIHAAIRELGAAR